MTPALSRGLLLAAVASVAWGTVPIAGRIALGGISAPLLSSIRLLFAAAFLAFVLRRRGNRPFRRPPRLVYLAAFGLGSNYLAYMWGLERAGAATSQVLIQTAPLFLIVLGVVWLKEQLSFRQLLGAAVAFVGVFLVSWEEAPDQPRHELGIVLILVASFTWGLCAAAHRRLGDRYASGPTMMWIFLLSAFLVTPFSTVEPLRRPDGVHLAAIAYLCLNSIVAYWSFAESLRHIKASVAAVILTLGPVVTFGLLLLTNRIEQTYIAYEALTALKLGGAALVIGGVCAAVTAPR
ncbi:MAG: DMT family transporter [Planctomycetota bacterium]